MLAARMRLAAGRVISIVIAAGGWLLTGAKCVLDAVGYSTIPDDWPVLVTRITFLLNTVPWWGYLAFALLSTMWLTWVSWPRSSGPADPEILAVAAMAVAPKDPQADARRQSIIDENRQMIARFLASEETVETSFATYAEGKPCFLKVRPYLSSDTLRSFGGRTVVLPPAGRVHDGLAYRILDDLDRIEREWGLREGYPDGPVRSSS